MNPEIDSLYFQCKDILSRDVEREVEREEISDDDRRVKFLSAGLKFDALLKDIGKLL